MKASTLFEFRAIAFAIAGATTTLMKRFLGATLFLLLLTPAPGWATPTIIQSNNCKGNATSGNFTCSITGVTAGDTVVVCTESSSGTLAESGSEILHSTPVNPRAVDLSASAPAMGQTCWDLGATQSGRCEVRGY